SPFKHTKVRKIVGIERTLERTCRRALPLLFDAPLVQRWTSGRKPVHGYLSQAIVLDHGLPECASSAAPPLHQRRRAHQLQFCSDSEQANRYRSGAEGATAC